MSTTTDDDEEKHPPLQKRKPWFVQHGSSSSNSKKRRRLNGISADKAAAAETGRFQRANETYPLHLRRKWLTAAPIKPRSTTKRRFEEDYYDEFYRAGEALIRSAHFPGYYVHFQEALLNEADINYSDSNGSMALICAAFRGDVRIVKDLLERPTIDVNLMDKHGYTALMYAIRRRHDEVVKLLEERTDIRGHRLSRNERRIVRAMDMPRWFVAAAEARIFWIVYTFTLHL